MKTGDRANQEGGGGGCIVDKSKRDEKSEKQALHTFPHSRTFSYLYFLLLCKLNAHRTHANKRELIGISDSFTLYCRNFLGQSMYRRFVRCLQYGVFLNETKRNGYRAR